MNKGSEIEETEVLVEMHESTPHTHVCVIKSPVLPQTPSKYNSTHMYIITSYKQYTINYRPVKLKTTAVKGPQTSKYQTIK